MKKIILLSFAAFSFIGNAQTTTPAAPAEKEWDVSMYGFVRTDYIYDSRKESSVREDQLNLYPLDVAKDINGKDVNAVGQSNFLSVTSRLGAKVKGPNVWGAKMNGTLEGDFYGNVEGSSIGLFRLRHAFVTMDWSKTQVTMGQTWYPTFIPEVFPGVANFNTGILFNPFGWATQAKLKQNFTKEFSAALTLYKEREFTNATATTGTQNSASINSAMPSLNLVFQFKNQNWIAGLGAEYKSLQPLTDNGSTTAKLATTEKVNSSSVFGYAKYSNDKFSVKAYGISGGNLNSLVMLGGFVGNTTNGIQSYNPIKTTAYWVDIASNGKSIAPGFFFGYTKNDGSSTAANALSAVYMRGLSGTRVIDNVWRASARVDLKKNKFRVSPELEYTAATWGDADLYGEATDNKTNVGNLRAMVSCVYSF